MKKNKILALLAAGAIAAAPALRAQSADVAQTPSWSEHVGEQVAQLLASPSSEIRQQGLELALGLSARRGLDLSAAAAPLVEIYRTSGTEASRLAALSVLVAIGDEEAMQAVRRDVARQESERVRLATFGALAGYYGTGTFELDREVAAQADDLRDAIALARW